MDRPEAERLSRRLSYVLRHHPASVGVELAPGGWVAIGDLLAGLTAAGVPATEADLAHVVAEGPKRRFAIEDGRIRAVHGHSVDTDLHLTATAPPPVLLHGTVHTALASIAEDGLLPRSRQHVHLSEDLATARDVAGRRAGRVVVLAVGAAFLAAAGQTFHRSSSGVWLTGPVPPGAITDTATGDPLPRT